VSSTWNSVLVGSALALGISGQASAQQRDVQASKDHPVITRYKPEVTAPGGSFHPGPRRHSGNGKLDGVYRSLPSMVDKRPDLPYGTFKYQAEELYATFFPDGRFFEYAPEDGLDRFDIEAELRKDPVGWGNYQISGDRAKAIFLRTQGDSEPYSWDLSLRPDGFVARGDTRIQFYHEVVYKLLDRCDRLRLEGVFRREDYQTPYSPTQGIAFTPDGRFQDEGVFKAAQVLHGTEWDDGVPGRGTYRIANYTVELAYSDGRNKRTFFFLAPGASKTAVREIYINTWKFIRVQ
jgi:hypothetical protein